MPFRFADCTLDPERRELHRAGQPVAVEPQVFDLLLHLLRHRERVVTRDELIEQVWGGRIVSESTLATRINAARRAIGDTGEAQALIRTLSRRGLRFVGAVAEAGAPQAPAMPDPAPLAARIRYCRAPDGVSLAMAESGAGPTLVRVSNWLSHVEYDLESPIWRPLLSRLGAGRRLIRYDARGNGLSDRDVADISFDAFVGDLAAVVEAAGAAPVSLFAMSQGAAVALAYAAAHPDRVARIVLHGGYARGRNRRGSLAEQEVGQAFVALMRHGWGDEHSGFMRAFSSVYMPSGTAEQVGWWCELQRRTTSAETAIRIRLACDALDVEALLPAVRCPVLVLHSRRDQVVPFAEGRRIAAGLAGAEFVAIESDNHVVLADEPAWPDWIGQVERFLAG
jgi:DNA-binding winged helix-turn-helix (wHTH) protein/pimeloyl-ACP methyl ester carboxylesterase